jgi:hypothetical protein
MQQPPANKQRNAPVEMEGRVKQLS